MATWKTRWNPTEAREQKAFVRWVRMQYPNEILFSIPNHLVRSPAQAMNEYNMGMYAGASDLCILSKRGAFGALFVEMKRKSGGIVSDKQESFLERVCQKGYEGVICNGFDEAMQATKDYFNIPLSR